MVSQKQSSSRKKQSAGHAAHTKSAQSAGLSPEPMPRPIKVTILGAGSFFILHLLSDILKIPGNQGGTIALVDIDKSRLDVSVRLAKKLFAVHNQTGKWKVEASTGRKSLMKGTDYLINTIEVNGRHCVRTDNDIPAKYGIDQCIGDTLGPGGVFKALRTIPTWLDILKDAERYCPEALVLNYTNPMGMMCLAAFRSSAMPVIGLCHSVQGTADMLARRVGLTLRDLEFECAGINHLAWFTTFKHQEKSLYPALKKHARDALAGKTDGSDIVRQDMLLHFGCYITESSGHLSEYLPYYRKRKDLIEKYCYYGEYSGGSSFYADNWPKWRENQSNTRRRIIAGKEPPPAERSWEYASWIIEAREKDAACRVHGNVYNKAPDGGALITNLPPDSCVEVACLIDRNGIHPTRYGSLPPAMAAISRSNMGTIELGAMAAMEKSKDLAIEAVMLDPLSSAVLCPSEIRKMVLELFRAQAKFLPGFK